MPGGSQFVVFVGAAVTLLLMPGPAVAFILARSGAHGRRAGQVSVLGVHSATCVHVLGACSASPRCSSPWRRPSPP